MLAVHCSTGHLGHAQCSSQSQILVRNGVFGGYGRAQTQNDGRTPRKLVVDKDRNTVGETRMRVGRGGRCRFIRVARAFYGSESRGLFGRPNSRIKKRQFLVDGSHWGASPLAEAARLEVLRVVRPAQDGVPGRPRTLHELS